MANSESPLVRPVIRVPNGEDTAGETIRRLLAQTYTNLNFRVANNHGTDGTLPITDAGSHDTVPAPVKALTQ
jgi:glycosyltransferase involved in cell wall biosynthesis